MCLLRAFSCAALAALLISNIPVVAAETGHAPTLGDIMAGVQLRHAKLWYAARAKNWSLADYELTQLNSNFKEVVRLYPKVLGSNMTSTEQRMILIGEAIKAQNGAKFDPAFRQMTAACNSCHEATNRPFIVIRTPAFPSPYSNQVFAPRQR